MTGPTSHLRDKNHARATANRYELWQPKPLAHKISSSYNAPPKATGSLPNPEPVRSLGAYAVR